MDALCLGFSFFARIALPPPQGSTISHYRVEWDVRADFTSISSTGSDSTAGTSMSIAGYYDTRAIRNNGSSLSCQSSNCTFAVGAEVQTLDVYSGDTNELSSGEYRLSYTTGSVADGTDSTVTSDCVSFDATYDELGIAVENVTGSSVIVAREKITDPGYGYRYWVTFMGAAVIGDVPALEATDFSGDNGTCSSWSVVTGSSSGVDVTAATTQQHVSVATQVNRCIYFAFNKLQPEVPILYVFLDGAMIGARRNGLITIVQNTHSCIPPRRSAGRRLTTDIYYGLRPDLRCCFRTRREHQPRAIRISETFSHVFSCQNFRHRQIRRIVTVSTVASTWHVVLFPRDVIWNRGNNYCPVGDQSTLYCPPRLGGRRLPVPGHAILRAGVRRQLRRG